MRHPSRRSFKTACLALLLFSLASALPAAQKAPAKIDPCALLTKAEIQNAVGKPVQDGKLNTAANQAVGSPCQFVVGDYGMFSLLVKPLGPGETPDLYLAMFKKNNSKWADAPGVGGKAFFLFPGYGMIQLNAFKGTSYILITMMVPGLTEDAQKAPAEKLMKLVLSKI